MSSPWRASMALVALLAAAGCARETRDFSGRYMQSGNRGEAFSQNAWQISEGQRLFSWMNCTGCHSHGGGGMGPALMDANWRYGGEAQQIVATILDGRPNGMPSFRDRITENQAWQLAAYVRSLSARTRQDALSARSEGTSSVEPPPLQSRRGIRLVSPEEDSANRP